MLSVMRKAALITADRQGIVSAAEKLRLGGNVAFPTETVYGLGGNALDEKAVLNIFKAKGRPLTDPLIVHVLDYDHALDFVEARGETNRIFKLLASHFWPGPLTLVLKANASIPAAVSARTGFIGVRSPSYPIARELLRACKLPLAAPSANRFGHVSPTLAQHVVDDLGDQDILILDSLSVSDTEACEVGIESTVLKVEDISVDSEDTDSERQLVLYRRGGVPEVSIRNVLDEAGFKNVRIVSPSGNSNTNNKRQEPVAANIDSKQEAPGQLLTHYAPDIDTWLIRKSISPNVDSRRWKTITLNGEETFKLDECALIDFGGTLSHLEQLALAYTDISSECDVAIAAHRLFEALRWSEKTNAKHVLIQDVSFVADSVLMPSVVDRMFRAASGKVGETIKLAN